MSAEVASDRLAPVQKGWGGSPPRQHTLRELGLLEGRFWVPGLGQIMPRAVNSEKPQQSSSSSSSQ